MISSDSDHFFITAKDEHKGLQSQSLVAEYIITGDVKATLSTRIEKAVIEGSVLMNPLGFESDKVMVITNQVCAWTVVCGS